ncbi:homogentisate-dioxygenase [Grosmannia clavigera kw1407]|uniref:homogentisate 1,2-dioxygenase n=1 Tax=Grosmannia clavigera (strain kw1407 / UAMH 11150) TaxID=655863 RepID=F0XQF8_GROCL|nr:homogentisate-dioxygenase [Grosmannia clavigera kw1407]EFX00715.1 homogentisate-dioxygenase [Grosmannia clavigera kw1407]
MPATEFDFGEKYCYQNGFSSYLETEAITGALPVGQNSPLQPAYGLYTEKLSGTSFTAPRHENKQSWLYRITPASALGRFKAEGDRPRGNGQFSSADRLLYLPDQFRWDPFPDPTDPTDCVDGLRQVAGSGDPAQKQGLGIFVFAANKSMDGHTAFYSADGDLLIVPQSGVLDIRTELGWLLVRPLEICVIPRGIRFQVHLRGNSSSPVLARGYALELYQGHFSLPELGPIGSNGLANARDFQAPVACFDDDDDGGGDISGKAVSMYTIRAKVNQRLYRAEQDHTPFDVVAWHGTYFPVKYDLGRFNVIGSISFDHPDPSIFTVLTAPSDHPGTAVADFVIFPPRWLVGENTFRPPWYHRNTMSEYMGLLAGAYDAKKAGAGGFVPGGASLHNIMSGHGPDQASHDAARREPQPQQPAKVGVGSCAFMFESALMLGVTPWALHAVAAREGGGSDTDTVLQQDYVSHSWGNLTRYWKRPAGMAKADGHLLRK